MGRIHGSGRRHSAYDWKQTDLPVKKRNHRTDLRYSERTAWISIYAVCRKSTDGNESRAYLCMHEFEKTGKDPGKTRLEHSQIFVDFEENKKKRSFKRKMVLGITPNTKFVYSLRAHHNRYALSITNDIAIQNNLNLFNPKQLAVSLHILPEILYRCAAKLIDYAAVHCTVSHDKHIFACLKLRSQHLLYKLACSVI